MDARYTFSDGENNNNTIAIEYICTQYKCSPIFCVTVIRWLMILKYLKTIINNSIFLVRWLMGVFVGLRLQICPGIFIYIHIYIYIFEVREGRHRSPEI